MSLTLSIHCIEHGELGVTCSAEEIDVNKKGTKMDVGFETRMLSVGGSTLDDYETTPANLGGEGIRR